jgi:hypothetical protein
MEKIQQLPPDKRAEVEDFVDFVANKTRRLAAFDRLLAIAPALQAAGVEPMSEDEVMTLLREVRTERRARRQQAEQDDAPNTPRP